MSTWDCAPKNSRVFQAVDVVPPGLRLAASTTVLAAHPAGSREDDAAPANVATFDLEGYSFAA